MRVTNKYLHRINELHCNNNCIMIKMCTMEEFVIRYDGEVEMKQDKSQVLILAECSDYFYCSFGLCWTTVRTVREDELRSLQW